MRKLFFFPSLNHLQIGCKSVNTNITDIIALYEKYQLIKENFLINLRTQIIGFVSEKEWSFCRCYQTLQNKKIFLLLDLPGEMIIIIR